jgi:hypothetical protein
MPCFIDWAWAQRQRTSYDLQSQGFLLLISRSPRIRLEIRKVVYLLDQREKMIVQVPSPGPSSGGWL